MKDKTLFKTLAPTVAMLLIAVLALSGVTYAWFTTANTATVGQMDLNVEAADGLLVSTKPTQGWKSNIAWDEIVGDNPATTQSNSQNITLKPVSTAGNVTTGKLNFFTADLANDSTKIKNVQAADSESTNGYLSFNLYFWNSGATNKTVQLTDTTVAAGTTDKSSQDALRIGFVTQSSAAMGTTEFTALASGTAGIYEPNAAIHTPAGKADYKATGGNASADTKYEYYGLKAAAASADTEFARLAATDVAVAVTTYDEAHDYITLPANQVTKVTVYVWLEGQDADCLNDISGSALSVNLKFAGAAVSE